MDLFTGFTTAILQFSKWLTAGQYEFKSLTIGPFKISYLPKEAIVAGLCVEGDVRDELIEKVLVWVADRFLARFGAVVSPGRFNFDVLQFSSFKEDLEPLRRDWEVPRAFASVGGTTCKVGAFHRSMANLLQGVDVGHAFEELRHEVQKGSCPDSKKLKSVELVEKVANEFLPDLDFAPLARRIRKNVLHSSEVENDYHF
ncbi:MAG: hypothetical protein Kow0069_34430 [Promethearchaeota archaeon]